MNMSLQKEGKSPTKNPNQFLTCQPKIANQQPFIQIQQPKTSDLKEINGKFRFDGVDYDLTLEKIMLNQRPENPIYVDQGINWYYVNDQQLIQQENGKYMPLYQNDNGGRATIDLKIIDQQAIKITCVSDFNLYTGMITEQEITKNQDFMKINELFETLNNDFKNPQHINLENVSINVLKNNQTIEFQYKIQLKVGNKIKQTEILIWNLERQKHKLLDEEKNQKKDNQILQKLDDILEIKKYIENELNKQLQTQFKEIKDQIQQFSTQQQQQIQEVKDQSLQQQSQQQQQAKNDQNEILNLLKEQEQKSQLNINKQMEQQQKLIESILDKLKNPKQNFQELKDLQRPEQNRTSQDQVDQQQQQQNQIITEIQELKDYSNKIKEQLNEQQKLNLSQMMEQQNQIQLLNDLTNKNFISAETIQKQIMQHLTSLLDQLTQEQNRNLPQTLNMFLSQSVTGLNNSQQIFQTILPQQQNNQIQQENPIKTESQGKNFKFKLDEVDYQLKLEIVNCKLPESLLFCDNDGIIWYYVNDQKPIQYKNGSYYIEFQNENGQTQRFIGNIKDQRAIKITCISDNYCYTGMRPEQEISQNHKIMTIEDVFDGLIQNLDKPQDFNIENGLINLKTINQNMEFQSKIQIVSGNNKKAEKVLKFNLLRQKDEQLFLKQKLIDFRAEIMQILKLYNEPLENQVYLQKQQTEIIKEIQNICKQFQEQLQKQQSNAPSESQSISIQRETDSFQLKINEQQKGFSESIINELKQLQQNIQELKKQQTAEQYIQKQDEEDNKNLLPTLVKTKDLIQTKGFFWVSPQCLEGVTTLEFTIIKINQMGLVIGLDHTGNHVIQPTYCIYINNQMLIIGQTKTKFQKEYVLKVGDQLFLQVDMNQRQVVLQANQQEIIGFPLDDQGEKELYFYVGCFQPFEDIKEFIE